MSIESWILVVTAAIGIGCVVGLVTRGIFAIVTDVMNLTGLQPHECQYQQPDCQKGTFCPFCERDIAIGEYRR